MLDGSLQCEFVKVLQVGQSSMILYVVLVYIPLIRGDHPQYKILIVFYIMIESQLGCSKYVFLNKLRMTLKYYIPKINQLNKCSFDSCLVDS